MEHEVLTDDYLRRIKRRALWAKIASVTFTYLVLPAATLLELLALWIILVRGTNEYLYENYLRHNCPNDWPSFDFSSRRCAAASTIDDQRRRSFIWASVTVIAAIGATVTGIWTLVDLRRQAKALKDIVASIIALRVQAATIRALVVPLREIGEAACA